MDDTKEPAYILDLDNNWGWWIPTFRKKMTNGNKIRSGRVHVAGGDDMTGRKDVLSYVLNKYGTKPEHLWEKYPTYEVFRHKNDAKWYGILMDIPRQKVGLTGNGKIDILVIKSKPEMVSSLAGQKGFAPAYHMNKTHWLSVLLDGTLKDDTIYDLLDMSYELTAK